MNIQKTIINGIVTCGLVLTPFVASAAIKTSQVDENRVVISFEPSMLEASSTRGELEREISKAAKSVCGVETLRNSQSLRNYTAAKSCYRSAVQEAMANLPTGELEVSANF